MKYGSNTPEVEAVIKKINKLTPEQIKALDAAWDEAYVCASWDEARRAKDAARREAWYGARVEARYAAWDALMALVVKDLITPEQFDLLYGPWASVMEVSE